MADMTSIINEIKGLEQYTKAMMTVYKQKGLNEDLANLLLHINTLKAWAGISDDTSENTLPLQRVSISVCKAPSKVLPCSHFYSNRCLHPNHCNFKQTEY